MSTQSLRTNGDDGSDREQLTIGDCEVCDTTSKYSVGALLSSAANATSSKISRWSTFFKAATVAPPKFIFLINLEVEHRILHLNLALFQRHSYYFAINQLTF